LFAEGADDAGAGAVGFYLAVGEDGFDGFEILELGVRWIPLHEAGGDEGRIFAEEGAVAGDLVVEGDLVLGLRVGLGDEEGAEVLLEGGHENICVVGFVDTCGDDQFTVGAEGL